MHSQPTVDHSDLPRARVEPARRATPLPTTSLESLVTAPYTYQTTVHPCIVDGQRTLVHRRGLADEQPSVFQRLLAFAGRHGFALREDRRKRQLSCRDERRRLAPLLMFAGGLLSAGVVADDGTLRDQGVTVVPTIDVIAERPTTDRKYLLNAGKRCGWQENNHD